MRVYGYDVGTKMQLSQWMGKGSPWPKKARLGRSKVKVVMFVFFDWKGIVHHEFVPHGHMVNKQLCQEVLAHLRDAVHRKKPEFWENQTWMLHHDSASAHKSLLIRSYLAKHQTSVVTHPPYSPDLAPADFFLFPNLKTTLKGHCFQTIEEIQENVIRELRAITESAFQEALQQCKKCWERCITSRGDLLWRGHCLKWCKMINKICITKVRSFFEHALYVSYLPKMLLFPLFSFVWFI